MVVKVIFKNAASPHSSMIFARLHQFTLLSNTCFLGHTQVQKQIDMLITSVVFVGFMVETDRPTDQPTSRQTIATPSLTIDHMYVCSTVMWANDNMLHLTCCESVTRRHIAVMGDESQTNCIIPKLHEYNT